MSVFVDTSALFAYLNQDDEQHAAAKQLIFKLVEEEETLVTSNYVLLETTALLQNRIGLAAVKTFEERIRPFLTIVWVDEALHHLALTAVLTANRPQLSLVDCVSFAICRKLRIQEVLAFDEHFTEQGFSPLEV